MNNKKRRNLNKNFLFRNSRFIKSIETQSSALNDQTIAQTLIQDHIETKNSDIKNKMLINYPGIGFVVVEIK